MNCLLSSSALACAMPAAADTKTALLHTPLHPSTLHAPPCASSRACAPELFYTSPFTHIRANFLWPSMQAELKAAAEAAQLEDVKSKATFILNELQPAVAPPEAIEGVRTELVAAAQVCMGSIPFLV